MVTKNKQKNTVKKNKKNKDNPHTLNLSCALTSVCWGEG